MCIKPLHSSCIFITLLSLASACSSDGGEGQPVVGAGGSSGATAGGAAGMGGIGGSLQGGGTGGSTMAGAGPGGTAGTANGGSAATAGAAGSGGAAAGGAGGSGGAAAGGTGGSGGSAAGGTGGSGGVDPGTEGDGDFTVDDFSVPPGVPGAPQGSFSGDGRWGGDDVNINVTSELFPGDHAVQIFIPDQYVNGTEAPFMIAADGLIEFLGGDILLDVVRNRAAADDERQVPPLVLIGVEPPDRNRNRSVEYDTVSDRYLRFINEDVIPAVLAHSWVTEKYDDFKLTSRPEGRGIYGCSSGGSAAMGMAWFGNFTRVMSFSGSFVSLQPDPPDYPNGAWDYAQVITDSPVQEGLRVFLHVGENDQQQGGTRNWIDGNQNLAKALADKGGYHYRFVTAANSGHCDRRAIAAILPESLTWLWRGYVAN